MTEQEYLWAWSAYCLGASLFFAVYWYITRQMKWREFAQLTRVLLLVLLIVPAYTDVKHEVLSPAWIVSTGDALIQGPSAFWRAGLPLVISLVVAMLLSTLYSLVQWYRQKQAN